MKPIIFHTPDKLRKILWYHLYIILLALAPLLVSIAAGFIGNCMGCNINEGGTDACVRLGISFGNVLNPLGVLGWLCIITVPLGIIAAIVLIIAAIHDTIYHKNNP
ncbi:hypothetical protein [Mucilaginibacter dorajii]|uniref:Uncharacterized protein n=1 Tax=Mucilaginibacter dorajii TaxID=692994 RepID=A0ABP7P683_9SPHI|nr:hypothetical protein [Mucilaginibacter dorajii]MCS3734575.1 hypothetical protein [Mucilaginibacter dorajii]